MMSLLTTVFFLLFAIFLFSSNCAYLISQKLRDDMDGLMLFGMISSSFYLIAQSLMISLFVIRIDKTFNGTNLEMNAKKINILYILVFILIFLAIIQPVSYLLFSRNFIYSVTIIWTLLHLILSILLIKMFIHRLNHILLIRLKLNAENTKIAKQQQSTSVDVVDIIRGDGLLRVAVKHSILVTIATTSTFIFFLIGAIIIFLTLKYNHYGALFIIIDSVVSSLCIYLLFAAHEKTYGRLCHKLHNQCEKWKLQTLENAMQSAKNTEIVTNQIEMTETKLSLPELLTTSSNQTSETWES